VADALVRGRGLGRRRLLEYEGVPDTEHQTEPDGAREASPDDDYDYRPDVDVDAEASPPPRRPPYLRNVIIAVLIVSVGALALLLVRSSSVQRHDVASVPDEVVLIDADLLSRAEEAVDRFQTGATNTARQLDLMTDGSAGEVTEGDLSALADQLNALVLLRCAVTGTGAQLEERMARTGLDGDQLADMTTAYARFANDFDKAVLDVFDGEVSVAVAAGNAQAFPTAIAGFASEARRWLDATLSDAAAIRAELARVRSAIT
jgi:Tfp pilus assembly protein PilV